MFYGAGPMAEWLSSGALLWRPRVRILGVGHAEAASHMPQLEGPTTKKNIQLSTGGLWGEEGKIRSLGKKKVCFKNGNLKYLFFQTFAIVLPSRFLKCPKVGKTR